MPFVRGLRDNLIKFYVYILYDLLILAYLAVWNVIARRMDQSENGHLSQLDLI